MLQKSGDKVHRNLLKGESAFFRGDTVEWYSFLVG